MENEKTTTKKEWTEKEWMEHDWDPEFKKLNPDNIGDFLKSLVQDYKHDYGTIVRAIGVGASATAWALNNDKEYGGLTGFQASFIPFVFLRLFSGIEGAVKLTKYDDMLFPQYEEKFEKTIPEDIWKDLQEKAKNNLEEDNKFTATAVKDHWKSIVEGNIPFGYTIEK